MLTGYQNKTKQSKSNQYTTLKKTLDKLKIFTSKTTHIGRQSGAIQMEEDEVPKDYSDRHGNWVKELSQRELAYINTVLPMASLRSLSGFDWEKVTIINS